MTVPMLVAMTHSSQQEVKGWIQQSAVSPKKILGLKIFDLEQTRDILTAGLGKNTAEFYMQVLKNGDALNKIQNSINGSGKIVYGETSCTSGKITIK